MFPSSGYFKGIDCPFFASGLCDRPNCHFRHKEESSSQVPVYIPTVQSKPPSLLGLVGIATKQLSRTTPSALHSNGAPQYIPTPISVLEQLKKQKTSESQATLQRVTLGDIAQFSNEELHADSASTAGTAGDFCPNRPRTSDLKRKFDELECNAEESANLKKVKPSNDVAELTNRVDSTSEPCPSGLGVVSLPPKTIQSLKKDSNLNIKNEKLTAKGKPIKKSAEIISTGKDDKKNKIKTNVIKMDSSANISSKSDKCQNKNTSNEAGFKATCKDAQLQKASSSSSLIGDIKRPLNKLGKESEVKKSDTGSCKVKSKLDLVLKSKDVSKKSQSNVESLKIAESIQLQMDLFGNPLSGGNQKNEKADDGAIKQKSKNGVTIRIDKQIAKDGGPLKQSINSSKGAKTYEPSKHISRRVESIKRSSSTTGSSRTGSSRTGSSTTGSSNRPSMKRERNNSCQQLASESGFSNSDMEPSDGGGIDDDGDDDCRIVDDDDDDDVTSRLKECYKIFMEPQSKKPKEQHKLPVQPSKPEEGSKIVGKQRIAHQSASSTNNVPTRPKNAIKDHKQVMIERLNEAKQRQANEIAHEAEKATSKTNNFSAVSLKGSRRIAHVPSKEVLKRPMITFQVTSGLVPINHRLMQLNKIIDKCLEIYDTQQDAYTRSLEEEKKLMTTCPSKFAYNSRLVSLMINLNREVSAKKDNKSDGDAQLVRSNKDCNFTFNRCGSMEPPPLTEKEMYKRLQSYILTEDQLKEHGFPFRDPETKAIVAIPNKKYSKDYSTDANRKICCRCSKEFVILKNGNYLRKEECVYHWGPYWKKRVAGNIDHRYNCCGGSAYDRGCEVAEFHVHEDNKFVNLTGFVSTLPCSPKMDDFYGIYALDCEMIYTVAGCELARITVIDFNLKVVYDKLVKPDSRVVDYNTRFSGIKKEDMEDVRTTLRDVQAVLLTMFNDKTILIGHSLENDLLSLKLLHQNIVDTSVVFPHKNGFPYKRALKNLSVEILKKTIQQNLDGHDSKEDASACMELMMQKVKEDMKRSMRVSRDQMLSSSRSFF